MQCIKQKRIKNGYDMITTFPCGKCTPCIITRRQEWVARLLLEMKTNLFCYFITLTYSDFDLPEDEGLSKEDIQDFTKELRRKYKIRYMISGEYGEKGRAHYHGIIFTNREFNIKTRKDRKGKSQTIDSPVHQAWYANSFVDIVPIIDNKSERNIASYVAGYVLKKLDSGRRDDGKSEPWILTSNRPGLGAEYAKIIARRIKNVGIGLPGVNGVEFTKDLFMIKINGKKYPLGRYMREQIYKELGGDNRQRWLRKFAQHQKAIDRELSEDDQKKVESESANRAAKAYKKYLRNRNL